MKKIISLILAISMLATFGITVFAEDAETVGGKITLTQFLDANLDNTKTITLSQNGKTYEMDKTNFYALADKIILTSQLNIKQTEMNGLYITAQKTDGTSEYAYITPNGEADKYSLAMSRLPYAMYVADDKQMVNELLAFGGNVEVVTQKQVEFKFNTGMSSQLESITVDDNCGYWKFYVTNNSNSTTTVRIIKDTPTGEKVENPMFIFTGESKTFSNTYNKPLEKGIYYLSITTDGKNNLNGNIVCNFANKDIFNELTISPWAVDAIEMAKNSGLIPENFGITNYTQNITREKFCDLAYQILDKLGKLEGFKGGFGGNNLPFIDTKDEKILALHQMEIIKGKSDGVFAPNDFITREEVATILYRITQNLKIYISVDDLNTTFSYSDHNELSEWARLNVYYIHTLGIMNGTGDNKFSPKENYTIEQAIVTMVRLYDCK